MEFFAIDFEGLRDNTVLYRVGGARCLHANKTRLKAARYFLKLLFIELFFLVIWFVRYSCDLNYAQIHFASVAAFVAGWRSS